MSPSHSPGPDDCEFDADMMCYWTNDVTNPSIFKWVRHTGRTPSSSTGPSGDHTSGSGNDGIISVFRIRYHVGHK